MRTLAAAALLWLAPAVARGADAAAGPPRLAGEALVSATASVLHRVGESGYGFRLGLGRERDVRAASLTAGWLVTAAWRNDAADRVGVPVSEARLGLGVRLRSGRLGLGADAEAVRLAVDRASTSGTLVATGLSARLVGSVDAIRLGARGAVLLTLDVGLLGLGLGEHDDWEPSISLSAGLRL